MKDVCDIKAVDVEAVKKVIKDKISDSELIAEIEAELDDMDEVSSYEMTKSQCEELAMEIYDWLVAHNMWDEVRIYFNGFAIEDFPTKHDETVVVRNGNRYYMIEDIDPRDFFEYVNPDHIISMSFEGRLYDLLSDYPDPEPLAQFEEIFSKRGLYYELGDAWNLSVYVDE